MQGLYDPSEEDVGHGCDEGEEGEEEEQKEDDPEMDPKKGEPETTSHPVTEKTENEKPAPTALALAPNTGALFASVSTNPVLR